jgi:2-oxoacid:acceptor oxidoreductase gamma subunit (pyruvate/2-ketoisovalerate family)
MAKKSIVFIFLDRQYSLKAFAQKTNRAKPGLDNIQKVLKTICISVHGMSGQGVETAVIAIARAAVMGGMNTQSVFFPTYEKRGTHVWGFVKIDKAAILSKQAGDCDFCIVMEPSLVKDAAPSVKDGGTIVINTSQKPGVQSFRKRKIKVFCVDATGIASLASPKKPIPNLAMLGAFAKVFGKISLKALKAGTGIAIENSSADDGYKNVRMVK